MASREEFLTNKIFMNAVLPLLKVIVADTPSLANKFKAVHCIYQVSALDPEAPGGKYATHFQVNSDEWVIHTEKVEPKPMVELEFQSVEAMNSFFKGKIGPATLPKMKGLVKNTGAFVAFMMALLKMSSILTAKEPPEKEEDKRLMVKCYFYLLSSGISQLNKNGHEEIHEWAKKSPDRVYAWAVNDEPSVSAYIRVKAGKTRAGRGTYKRALPFFTMRFDSFDSALGILMQTADMLESTRSGKLIMDGAPEFGAQIGDFMMQVGAMAQG